MLRTRLITGTLLVVALVALLWADGAVGQAVDADGVLARALGGTDGVVIVPFALCLLVPLLGIELARLLRGAGVDAPTWLTVLAALAGAASVRAAPALGAGASAATVAIESQGRVLRESQLLAMDADASTDPSELVTFRWAGSPEA